MFGDRVIATAILDRLLHHAVTLNIRVNAYRLKEKLRAGLIRSHDHSSSQPGGENWNAVDNAAWVAGITYISTAEGWSIRPRTTADIVSMP